MMQASQRDIWHRFPHVFLTVTAGMEGSMHRRALLNVNGEVPDVASPPVHWMVTGWEMTARRSAIM